ncbi:MAG: adenylosuccinate synthase [Planctomycetes bacterium]|nr:adenylosuccinate synthase [Planctomycetota bacterium]
MPARCVLGAQWGDEGKGKIIDRLAEGADYVVRFSGGNNAGHTVVIGDRKFAVHLLPSGVFRDNVINLIGPGVVIDPWHLVREIESLEKGGIRVEPGRNLRISRSAHLILPWHRRIDALMEELRGPGKIGTTGRGIGPAYQDRASRAGLRFGDLEDPAFLRARLRAAAIEKNRFLEGVQQSPVDPEALAEELIEVTRPLLAAAEDTGLVCRNALARGEQVLFEGAQGLMLDVDLGTYPYVTSTSVGMSGLGGGAGVSPRAVDEVILVAKAYSTRVGEGPFPTELQDEIGARIRERGREFGTTTGRPRRCGWLDAVALRYACAISGADALYLTMLDVLSTFDEIRIAVAYQRGDEIVREWPAGHPRIGEFEPVYDVLTGFDEEIAACGRFEDLPEAAKSFVRKIESIVHVPIPLVSIGPERDQVLHVQRV